MFPIPLHVPATCKLAEDFIHTVPEWDVHVLLSALQGQGFCLGLKTECPLNGFKSKVLLVEFNSACVCIDPVL